MVHGDLHFGNVVRSRREPWLAVDPKGWVGDRAFDGWTAIVRAADSLLAAADLGAELRRRLEIFADGAELDRETVVRWTQLRTAIGAHHCRRSGAPDWEIAALEKVTDLLAS